MDLRNISGREALQQGMDEFAGPSLARLSSGMESAAMPRLHAAAEPSPAAREEAGLVARAQTGDQDAFGVLVRLHQRTVYNLAVRMLRDADEAGEATQEVFLAAWQGLRSFRSDARFATWLYRIAYHHCLKVTEGKRRESAVRAELAASSARAYSPASVLSAQHAQAAERAVCDTVRAEIANLPPKYRAVLVLRHLQELSYEEMAQVMSVPIGTVKTQLFRARALLKERLEDLDKSRNERLSRAGEWKTELGASLRSFLERGREQPQKEMGS